MRYEELPGPVKNLIREGFRQSLREFVENDPEVYSVFLQSDEVQQLWEKYKEDVLRQELQSPDAWQDYICLLDLDDYK